MIKLRCLGNYRNDPRNLVYVKGDVFEVDEKQAAFLAVDAPGCFEPFVEVKQARIVEDKTIKHPPADKGL